MDGTRIDPMTKLFAERRLTRRQVLTHGGVGLAAAGLAAVGLTSAGRGIAHAQNASPVASPAAPSGGTIVVGGLTNPRGMAWGPDGTLYVALAGDGGTTAGVGTTPASKVLGPFKGGDSASVVKIVNGCPVTVAAHFPSYSDAQGEGIGNAALAFLNGQLYVLNAGGGASHGNPNQPSGVYVVNSDGTAKVVADIGAWIQKNPVAHVPPDYDPDTSLFDMIALNGKLWLTDSNGGQILTVAADGTITRIADISQSHPVPTGIVPAPDGGVYVGTLGDVPFADGTRDVLHVAADGTVTTKWTGLTALTGLAIASDGTLYAEEMSTGNLQKPPFLVPGSGKIVRQTGDSSSDTVISGLTLPVGLSIGPDGALYVSQPAIGGGSHGEVLRFSLGGGTPAAATPMSAAPASCPVGTPTA